MPAPSRLTAKLENSAQYDTKVLYAWTHEH